MPAKNKTSGEPAPSRQAELTKAPEPVAQSEVKNEPVKPKRTARKPLLKGMVEATKKMLKRRTPVAKTPPPNAAKAVETKTIEPVPETRLKKAPEPVAPSPAPSTPPPVRRPKKTESPDVPSILLEGDQPPITPLSGPGAKFALGSTPPVQIFSGGELPESYGTKKLFLTARDPHWLYVHWDLTREQQNQMNAVSADGHLVVRVYAARIEGHPLYEIHVHPESRHWFVHVERAGNPYAAELGYYSLVGKWIRAAISSSTVTPPDAVSEESDTEFATIPFEFPFAKLIQIIEQAVSEHLPLAQAIEELRRHGHPELPRINGTVPSSWTPQQEQALSRIVCIDNTRRVWMGSLEITELIRRRLSHDVSSPVVPFGAPGSPGVSGITSVTSPFGGIGEKAKGFWFNVNAELIIYGATEPDAKVTLGGHEIKLRADGSFSYRFSLPDGKYDLPAVAVSADGADGREADLKFSRETHYLGEVGTHPQDPALKPPLPESL